tara:strand:+ start:768 stop:914 length:147 start_codon:yes stop_codon:yes gene_type:complete
MRKLNKAATEMVARRSSGEKWEFLAKIFSIYGYGLLRHHDNSRDCDGE